MHLGVRERKRLNITGLNSLPVMRLKLTADFYVHTELRIHQTLQAVMRLQSMSHHKQDTAIILLGNFATSYWLMRLVFLRDIRIREYLTWPPHSAHTITQDILNIRTQLFNILILIVNIQHDGWVLDDIFVNNYILDECTYRWITVLCNNAPWWWSKWPEHIGAMNWQNMYNLCIL